MVKISSITNHAVARFKERIEPFGGTTPDSEIREKIKKHIENCPQYVGIENYFMNEMQPSKKIPIPILGENGHAIGEFKVVLKKDSRKEGMFVVITIY